MRSAEGSEGAAGARGLLPSLPDSRHSHCSNVAAAEHGRAAPRSHSLLDVSVPAQSFTGRQPMASGPERGTVVGRTVVVGVHVGPSITGGQPWDRGRGGATTVGACVRLSARRSVPDDGGAEETRLELGPAASTSSQLKEPSSKPYLVWKPCSHGPYPPLPE